MGSPCKASSGRGRRLYELLEEQQEPFLSDAYLQENDYSERSPRRMQHSTLCWSGRNVPRLLPRLASLSIEWRRGGFCNCMKIIKKVLHWAPEKVKFNFFSCLCQVGIQKHTRGFERLYCPNGQSERDLHLENCDDQEQLSPVSVLDLHSDQEAADEKSTLGLNSQACEVIRELLACSCYPPLTQYAEISKSDWQQSKRLMLEYMEEMEQMTWNSSKGIMQLVASELSSATKQWRHHQTEIHEIGAVIAYRIFEEMREEVVWDILGPHCM